MVSIVVLTYNRKEELRYTLDKLDNLINSCNGFEIEVIVVDNASADGTADMVATSFPQFNFIRLPDNTGIAGRNEGIKIATGKYVLILDDDAHIEVDSLESAVEKMEKDPNIGILSFNIVSEQGISSVKHKETIQKELTFCAAVSLIRRAVFQKAGYFSRIGFLYHDETDFAIRVLAEGYRIHFARDLIGIHRVSQTSRPSGRNSYYGARNTVFFLVKYFSFGGILFSLPAFIVVLAYNIFLRPNRIAYVKGLISGLILAPKARAEEGRKIPRHIEHLYLRQRPYLNIFLLLHWRRILEWRKRRLLMNKEKG